MRCRDDAWERSQDKEKKTTSACQRTRARQAPRQIHHNACLKHSNSSTDPILLIDQLLCSWNIMATTKGQRLKHLVPHIQIPTRSVHRMFRIRSHGSFSCCFLHIHALSLAEQSLGESVTAISPSTLQITKNCSNVSRSRHVSKVSAAGNTQFLQYLRKIDSVRPSPDVIHTG